MKSNNLEFPWLKNRGYLHITPQVNLEKDKKKILSLVQNKDFISRYAFFPLIHSVINERRYKRIHPDYPTRAHSFINSDAEIIRNVKSRPLHYATHLDAIIFGYYAEILLNLYEKELLKYPQLGDSITAYRRIPIPNDIKNKSTIHFANETFNEIKKRATPSCEVLKFDIKSFFSRINHQQLKKTWANLLNEEQLPSDHYKVFKAATKFSYIIKDDFRLKNQSNKKRKGFDEKRLAYIRKQGVYSFFESAKEFRENIKTGNIKLHQFPFRDKTGTPVGIPQGLPISAILANLYLLQFDINIHNHLVKDSNVFYRRYSDDIIVICKPEQADFVENYVNTAITDSKVEISKDKTERFLFKKTNDLLNSYKISNGIQKIGIPFTYLGFEYYGNKILIKSTNLSKFYRRMIHSVKTKAQRALSVSIKNPYTPITIFRRRLYKLYIKYPLRDSNEQTNYKRLVKNKFGDYYFTVKQKTKSNNTNYLSYVHRASDIMNEESIKLQIRNHHKIFNQALKKHLNKVRDKK